MKADGWMAHVWLGKRKQKLFGMLVLDVVFVCNGFSFVLGVAETGQLHLNSHNLIIMSWLQSVCIDYKDVFVLGDVFVHNSTVY